MSNPEAEKRSPSRGTKHICVPFASEGHYQECVADVATYRTYLTREFQQHPELFPQAMGDGYTFHDRYRSRKQGVVLRRIKLKATAEVFTVRPSFVMPYLIARTAEVEKALFLRQWGVPFTALAKVFGRDAMFWYRAWLQFGRPNLVGTTVKRSETMPQDLVADEKITWLEGAEVVVPTTVGGGCVLGISVAQRADSDTLKDAYGEFVAEATAVFPPTRYARFAPTASRRRARLGGGSFLTLPWCCASCTPSSRSKSAAGGQCAATCWIGPGTCIRR